MFSRLRAPAGRGHPKFRRLTRVGRPFLIGMPVLEAGLALLPRPVAGQALRTQASTVGYGATAVGLSVTYEHT
jgi:hypothetical protein